MSDRQLTFEEFKLLAQKLNQPVAEQRPLQLVLARSVAEQIGAEHYVVQDLGEGVVLVEVPRDTNEQSGELKHESSRCV